MATILCRTKGNANPKGKPRVYFTCHPEDFDRYFDKLCEDIFKTHDCAIFYTEDMNAVIAEEDKPTDLESNNLFIVPVTFRLLSKPNRAMDADIPFAFEKHIPVLPFMMEPSIDKFYAGKFGELQYLNPYSTDLTEISYEEKLKKYLESVLISDEMAKRVRAAFDAYIFLSYRKKDRRYANELMRLIHSHPECRDIAIWFDEFLTPGESFKTNIEKALQSSKLFALLVTPSLLEEPDGKPNFVMGVEYPEAQKSGIDILPAEMEETDKDKLSKKFAGIPSCVKPDDEAFKALLLESIAKIATTTNDDSTHNFLIGLAYLDGIDVEVDRQRGLDLITSAAEAELPEAMEKLCRIHYDGPHPDYQKSVKWAERLFEYHKKHSGENHENTTLWLINLAQNYNTIGEYKKTLALLQTNEYDFGSKDISATLPTQLKLIDIWMQTYVGLGGKSAVVTEIYEKIFAINSMTIDEDHPYALFFLRRLAISYSEEGNHKKAIELCKKCYYLSCQRLGTEHTDTLAVLSDLATVYSSAENYKEALELHQKAYVQFCNIYGTEHPTTLTALENLAIAHSNIGNYSNALELLKKAYDIRCKISGEEHPSTVLVLQQLVITYSKRDQTSCDINEDFNEKAFALERLCRVLLKQNSDDHPEILTFVSYLASYYQMTKDFDKEIDAREHQCEILKKQHGEGHPDTLEAMHKLVVAYENAGESQKAKDLYEKICSNSDQDVVLPNPIEFLEEAACEYRACQNYTKEIEHRECLCELLTEQHGEDHPDTLSAMHELSIAYGHAGESEKAQELFEKIYEIQCNVLGYEHPDSLSSLHYLAFAYGETGDVQKEFDLNKKVYALRCKVLGKEHPDTLKSLNNLAYSYGATGDLQKEIELREQVYALRLKIFGEDHPDTVQALEKLHKAQRKMAEMYKQQKACQHCGGVFVGLFKKRCSKCGKPKDY